MYGIFCTLAGQVSSKRCQVHLNEGFIITKNEV